MRLSGLEPGGPSDDLTAWAQRLQGITMVGLGEATHGSREFFTLKHRLIEHLVTEQGFTTFAVEADRELCRPLDDFLRDGSGDPARLLRELGYWTWCTEEVLALIRWLREHNAATPPHRSVRLVGVDPPHRRPRGLAGREEAMARALLELGDQRSVFWGHNGHVCTGRVNGRTPSTGARVRDELGSGYYALGLTFHQGAFGVLSRTRQGVRGPQERAVGEAPTRSLEHALAATGRATGWSSCAESSRTRSSATGRGDGTGCARWARSPSAGRLTRSARWCPPETSTRSRWCGARPPRGPCRRPDPGSARLVCAFLRLWERL